MNRFRSGLVPLIALLALVSCNSEPTEDLRNGPTELVASPTQLFIEVGGTKTVEVGGVDTQGNPIDLNYEVTATGPGITVRRDSSFLPIFVNDTLLQAPAVGPRFRFVVEGTDYAASSFTVSAGGLDLVVPVQVVPQVGLAATFDKPVSVLGDTITLTAPAGITFADTANLEIPGNTLIPLIVSQDATTIRFIAPPSVTSPIIVHGVIAASAPSVVFAPATDTPLQTPLIDTVDVTLSTATPTLGQTVTMAIPEPLINFNQVVDSIIYPGQLPGREPGPTSIVVAPDSSSLTFAAPPNADGSGTVVNFAFPGNFLIALPTRPNLTSANIGLTFPATFSNTSPAVSETVVMTAPAGFTFDDTTTVTVGAAPAIFAGRAADGSTVSFVPVPGSVGVPQIDGIVPTLAPGNRLTMPAEDTLTVPATVPELAGSDDPATAPSLSTPGLGSTSVLFDSPDYETSGVCASSGDICHYYKLTVGTAGTFAITVDWNVGGDIDFVVCDGTCGDFFGGDLVPATTGAAPGATAAHPENGTYALAPGTYWVVADDFGGDAAGTTLRISIRRTL